jgi:putative flippase GtrA
MIDRGHALRFTLNGLVATAAHFSVLTLLIEVGGLPSAGLANLLAATVGVSMSFLGNRHFVFRAGEQPWKEQALRFAVLYAFTTLMHGGVLFGWTDVLGRDYRAGFLLATGLQFAASYVGNRWLVFRPAER